MLTKTKNWNEATDGAWPVLSSSEIGNRIIATDENGSTWFALEQGTTAVKVADKTLAPSVLAAMADATTAALAAKADAAAKADDAMGPAVVAKLRAVAGGTGTLTQVQIAKLFLGLAGRL